MLTSFSGMTRLAPLVSIFYFTQQMGADKNFRVCIPSMYTQEKNNLRRCLKFDLPYLIFFLPHASRSYNQSNNGNITSAISTFGIVELKKAEVASRSV